MSLPSGRSYFTVEARVALVIARKNASEQGVGTLDSGHLLLALLDPPGDPIQRELVQLGLDTTTVAAMLRALLPRAEPSWEGMITLADPVKAVIESAVSEVRRSPAHRIEGPRLIDDRHLFLSIVQHSEAPISVQLRERGFALDALVEPVRTLPPRIRQQPPGEWLKANHSFVTIAACCLILLVALAAPFPNALDGLFLYPLVCGIWLLLYALVDYGAATESYIAGERSIRASGRLRLGPQFSLPLALSCAVPIALAFVIYHYGFAP